MNKLSSVLFAYVLAQLFEYFSHLTAAATL